MSDSKVKLAKNKQQTPKPKPMKANVLHVLEVLKEQSNANKKLTRNEIIDYVHEKLTRTEIIPGDYPHKPMDKNTVKGYLDQLVEMYPKEIIFEDGDRKKGTVQSWYYKRDTKNDLKKGEIRMIKDGLLYSKSLKYTDYRAILRKLDALEAIYSKYSDKRTKQEHLHKDIFANIESILKARKDLKKVSFNYKRLYGMNKKPELTLDKFGNPRKYIVTPYEVVITGGRYYLICVPIYDKYMDLHNFRVDYIDNLEVLDEPKPETLDHESEVRNEPDTISLDEYKDEYKAEYEDDHEDDYGDDYSEEHIKSNHKVHRGAKSACSIELSKIQNKFNATDLKQYMKEHIYMTPGPSARTEFIAEKWMIGQVVDWFGNGSDVELKDETEKTVTVALRVNQRAMFFWALQYGAAIEVIYPEALRKDLKEAVAAMNVKYSKEPK